MEIPNDQRVLKIIHLLIAICLLSVSAYAKYSGGTGEPGDPYKIAKAGDLMLLGNSPEDYEKHFMLTNDISVGPSLLGGKGFDRAVIAPDSDPAENGFQGTPFTGVFDGNDHTIFHLTFRGEGYLGLFGQLDVGAKVSNLGLEAVSINGTADDTGGLAGHNYGNITLCYSTGKVNGGIGVGGLVGINYGHIARSSSMGTVSGRHCIGGLAGVTYGRITRSYSTGTVSGRISVGGLAGANAGSGIISMSYSTCLVSAEWSQWTPGEGRPVGGLAGENYGFITNCYSTGAAAGRNAVGGLVGLNRVDPYYPDSILNCYSTGAVSGGDNSGGLVGSNVEAAITNSFWDIRLSHRASSGGGTGLTTPEMQTAATFLEAGWDFLGETQNGADEIWWILEGQDYPRLCWEQIPEN